MGRKMEYPGRVPDDLKARPDVPQTEWISGAKDCPGNSRGACINGNRGYRSTDEAWTACKVVTECGFVAQIGNSYYLRRASDPDRADGRKMAYPGRVPEDLMPEPDAPQTEWITGAKDCPGNARGNCINGNRGYRSTDDAWTACKVVTECGYVAQIGNSYYLRRASDPDRADGRKMAYPGRVPEESSYSYYSYYYY